MIQFFRDPNTIRWALRIAGGIAGAIAVMWPNTAMVLGPISGWLVGLSAKAPGDERK